MKRLFLSGFLSVALAPLAIATPAPSWINNGTTNCPPSPVPSIDATNVINNGQLNITLPFTSQFFVFSAAPPFTFSDVLNYTNRGLLTCDAGFVFNDTPPGTSTSSAGTDHTNRSALFGNANIGTIQVGVGSVIFNGNTFSDSLGGTLIISATNVVNNGTLEVAANGLLSIDGATVDLSRGSLISDPLESFTGVTLSNGVISLFDISSANIFDAYWGLGLQTNQVQSGFYNLPTTFSPSHNTTNTLYQPGITELNPQNSIGAANILAPGASNFTTQIVIVGNTNSGITTSIRFEPSGGFSTPVVQWQAVTTNSFGTLTTNLLFLSDTFGAQTNFQLFTNFTTQGRVPLLTPVNYEISTDDQFDFAALPLGNIPYSASLIPSGGITNQYVAMGVTLSATTFTPDPNLPDQNLTNIPGRIQINADKFLNLTRTLISGPNFLRLFAPNHFAGSAGADITAPNLDISLGTTNGQLNITNLVAPFIPEIVGTIDVYSARWTNVDSTGVTNSFHILMVDSRLSPVALPLIQNFQLRSTNVVISDVINVASNFLVNATSLTITSNAPNAQTPYGQLNLQSPDLIWASTLPVLLNFTNVGLVTTPNTVNFAQIQQPPFFATNATVPYQNFVNHGSIVSSGNTTWATNFENSGAVTNATTNYVITNPSPLSPTTNLALIFSGSAPINIEANTARLFNGALVTSPFGDISINAGTLLISNHFILADGALTLTVTNQLSDGGVASNFWSVTDGINLALAPLSGDLLGTTVTNTAIARLEVDNLWAGQDRGPVPAGFLNNGALGHLILDGGNVDPTLVDDPQFHFLGPDPTQTTNYAIYVDLLELRDGATNNAVGSDQVTFFSTFDIDPNMTVYFADAIVGNIDLSEKLNGANGGRLVWVPAYAGIFSGTNLVFPAGVTNRFNRALVISTDIDSDGDGHPNSSESMPFYTASSINLMVGMTNLPARTPAVSWFSLANATNFLYYRTNLTSTNWLLVTNFVQTLPSRTVTVLDRGRTNSTGFYKVQVNPIQP